MEELVIKYYRKLLRNGFEYAGSMENPSIFIDSVGEKVHICGQVGRNYLHIYISVNGDTVEDIKYKCLCDPTANVVVEILCGLVKGQTLTKVTALAEDDFVRVLGSEGDEFRKKVRGAIELINRGITRYRAKNT